VRFPARTIDSQPCVESASEDSPVFLSVFLENGVLGVWHLRTDDAVVIVKGTSEESPEIRYGIDSWASLVHVKVKCYLCDSAPDAEELVSRLPDVFPEAKPV
jgi:hypothetical protein